MKYLVTGSAGFVGYHLTRRLLEEGAIVLGFDGMTDYYDQSLKAARNALLCRYPNFTFMKGRLEDIDALLTAIEAGKPEVLVHLAAQAGVRYSLESPRSYVDSNFVGSFNLLEAARRSNLRHLLLASSSSVYGASKAIPFREDDPASMPMSIYAATKKAMEDMAYSYSHLYKLPMTAFRFFTVYGPWGRPDMALFKFTGAMLKGQPIDVYGQGKMQRDFTFVDDLVEAIIRLIPLPPNGGDSPPFRVVNIGSGRPIVLDDFVSTLEKILGRTAVKRLLPMQPGDMPITFAAADRLKELTGYLPSTPLETGVRAFVEWYRDHYKV